jgi:hypothetical protein
MIDRYNGLHISIDWNGSVFGALAATSEYYLYIITTNHNRLT